jgi:hypothetical protein
MEFLGLKEEGKVKKKKKSLLIIPLKPTPLPSIIAADALLLLQA